MMFIVLKIFYPLTVDLYSSQLTINTAIVYMHRFYMHHSFTKFHRNVSMTTLISLVKLTGLCEY